MPPKVVKKVDKKKKEEEAEAPLSVNQQNILLQRQVEALQLQLAMENERTNAALHDSTEMRQRLHELYNDFVTEKQRFADVSLDLTRQYKSMREELLAKIAALEETIELQKQHFQMGEANHQEELRIRDEIVQGKDRKIERERLRSEYFCNEFEKMLKLLTGKMSEKIEMTNSWQSQRMNEITVRTFEEFHLSEPA